MKKNIKKKKTLNQRIQITNVSSISKSRYHDPNRIVKFQKP